MRNIEPAGKDSGVFDPLDVPTKAAHETDTVTDGLSFRGNWCDLSGYHGSGRQ